MGYCSSKNITVQLGGAMSIDGNDTITKMMDFISKCERAGGKGVNEPLTQSEITGITLQGENLPTFGYGQVFTSTGQRWRDVPNKTAEMIRRDYQKQITNYYNTIKSMGINVSDNKMCVLGHRLHQGWASGKTFLKYFKSHLSMTPSEFIDYWIGTPRSENRGIMIGWSNWNLYHKNFTKVIHKEASLWN